MPTPETPSRDLRGFGEDEDDTQLFSAEDLDAIDSLLPESSAPKLSTLAPDKVAGAKKKRSPDSVISMLVDKNVISDQEGSQLAAAGTDSSSQLIKLLEQKGLLTKAEAEKLLEPEDS